MSSEEQLFFESTYSVEGVCLHCHKTNHRYFNVNVSYISELLLGSSYGVNTDWQNVLSPNNVHDTTLQCTDCQNIIFKAELKHFQN